MKLLPAVVAAALCRNSFASPIGGAQSPMRVDSVDREAHDSSTRKLHGRFLHLTDIHPDPFYKLHSSTTEEDACHRGHGPAGTYGAETTDCDTPFALVNATFKWIEDNLRDTVDFVVWTGDSARHDSDEKNPRSAAQVLDLNTYISGKFDEVFGNGMDKADATKDLIVPIIPTFGNNDILPHNILLAGPNKWLNSYSNLWRKYIPEEQRHGFERGGWFYVEVIPNKLAVFSLNTLYFFNHNTAVDGCALRSEPGFEHMEWLRIQLGIMRQRGMKAILSGHVPPARTDSKQLWDESCWQRYTLWLQQYRDVVVGGIYGHMNVDHFIVQDTDDLDIDALYGIQSDDSKVRDPIDEDMNVQSATDYLQELRDSWAGFPDPMPALGPPVPNKDNDDLNERKKKKKNKHKSKKDKALKQIGGPYGERFQITHIGPSVVPNYFPTLRVFEYNITGLEDAVIWRDHTDGPAANLATLSEDSTTGNDIDADKKKGKKDPDLTIPLPPWKSSPPGPAYSPQTLTLQGYTQYYANITYINNDITVSSSSDTPESADHTSDDVSPEKWKEGKHKNKHPKSKTPHPHKFEYEVEYSTFNESIYKLDDLTVGSYLKLAHRIGQYKPLKGNSVDESLLDDGGINEVAEKEEEQGEDELPKDDDDAEAEKKKHKHKKDKKKKKKQRERNKVWLQFVEWAFVGTLDEEELKRFETAGLVDIPRGGELHDGEI